MKLRDIVKQLQEISDKHPDIDFLIDLQKSDAPEEEPILANDLLEILIEDHSGAPGQYCLFRVETNKSFRPQ